MTGTAHLAGGYGISTDPARRRCGRVHPWLITDAYRILGRTRDRQDRASEGSLDFGAHATASGERVACARVVTDRATFARLCDVYAHPSVRGQGLGTALVAAVREVLRPCGLKRVLLTTHDAHGVHAPLGFRPLDRPGHHRALGLA
jgi:GNAT superfamily N-acetyltransferase